MYAVPAAKLPKEKIYFIKKSKHRACEKKSVKTVFYDYIFTYPAL